MSLIRRLFAAVVLLCVVGGAPVALWLFGRPLLPDHVPTSSEVKVFFTERDTGQLFLGALVVIGVVAWLVFTISLVVEAASMLAGRHGQWGIPGLRVPQRAAGALLALLFTAGITVGTAMPAAASPGPATSLAAAVQQYQQPASGTAAAAPHSAPQHTAVATTAAGPRAVGGPTWTVGRYDTLWRIADRALGDGSRFREVVTLNQHIVQADGAALTDADTPLHTGWVLQLPADAARPAGTPPAGAATAADTAAEAKAPGGDHTVRVRSGDTLSDIAEQRLGDGDLYPQLARANHLSNPDDLRIGETITIPAALQQEGHSDSIPGSNRTVLVQPGDTLTAIALREYGDADLYGRIATANRISDPDNVLAGSTLVIPPLSSTPAAAVPTHPSAPKPATTTPGPVHPVTISSGGGRGSPSHNGGGNVPGSRSTPSRTAPPSSAPSTSSATTSAPSAAATAPPTSAAAPATTSVAPTLRGAAPEVTDPVSAPAGGLTSDSAPVAVASTVQRAGADTSSASRSESSVMPALAVGGGAVLLTGLAFGALVAARRRQFRWRRPGRGVRATPDSLMAVERTLLTKGNEHAVDVNWLDEAMRSLAQQLAGDRSERIPDVVAAKLTDDELELVLARPAQLAPQPWRVDDYGLRWTLDRAAALPPLDRERSFGPLPALVSVGYTAAGEHWLIDLEMVGSISLTGDPERCSALLRYMAAELAHNAWSDGLLVSLVGVGNDLAAANPARLVCGEDLAPALDQMRIQLDAVEEVSAAAAVDVAAGRLHNIAGDTWATQVVLVGPDAAGDRSELSGLLRRLRSMKGRQAAAVVVTVDEQASADTLTDTTRWVLEVDEAGILKMPALELQMIAEQLAAGEAADLAALLALAATTDDVPTPPANGEAEWDTYADAAGALRPELTTPRAASPLRLAGTSPERDGSVLPLPTHMYVSAAAVTEEDVEVLAPGVSPEVRKQVEWSSRTLDADVANWWDERSGTPKVAVLGAVAVRAKGQLDPTRPRLAWNTELVTYLGLTAGGVTAEQMGADLWPDEPDAHTKPKLRNAVTTARRWLGSNPRTGRDHLPTNAGVAGARYRLEDVLVDAELFRRLRVRAAARGADGIADLQAALRLVSGVPLTDRRPRGYGWVGPMDHAFIGMVADTSHILATHLLAAGEPAAAMAAAQVALLAGSYGDEALMDCAAACFARDLTAEGESYVRRIMANHDAEVEEDLPKHTYEVLLQRGWLAS